MDPVFQTVEVEEITECYTIIKRLGQGTYGQVLLAQDRITGKPLAVKLVRKDRTKLRSFLRELSLSISLSDYPGLIATYPLFINTMDYYVLTQELAIAGTLHHLIQAQVGLPEDLVKRCSMQISRALDYMHGRGLVHRDLKPDNVLLMDKDCYHIKLSDFGLTQPVGSLVSSMSHIIPYMSPELCDLRDDEYLLLCPSVDTWAFGVLIFVALTGFFPWREAIPADTLYEVYIYWQNSRCYIPPPARWERFTREALYMLTNLLAPDPTTRPSVLSVFNYLNFPWKADTLVCNIGEAEVEVDLVEEVVNTNQFEFVIIQNQEGEGPSLGIEPVNPVLMVLAENCTLTLGSEVEIP